MIAVTIRWDKYTEYQSYLLTHLDILSFTLNGTKIDGKPNIDIIFYDEIDATEFKLKFGL